MMDGNVSFELALEISARLGMMSSLSSSLRSELSSWEARDGVKGDDWAAAKEGDVAEEGHGVSGAHCAVEQRTCRRDR